MTAPKLSVPAVGMKAAPPPQLLPPGLSLAEAVRQHAQNHARGGTSEAPAPPRAPSLPSFPQSPAFKPFPGYKSFPGFRPFPGYKPFPGYRGVK